MNTTAKLNSAQLKDPGTAATLSLLPGLGQIYNGQSRKGFLFLEAALINFVLLWLMLFTQPVISALTELGKTFHLKLNAGLLDTLQQFQFGTPASIVMLAMIVSFVALSVRDAYENAALRRRRALYRYAILELSEAASGSYIFHVSLIGALGMMALFFCVPLPAAKQLVEIEFTSQTVKETVQPSARVHAQHSSREHARNKSVVSKAKSGEPAREAAASASTGGLSSRQNAPVSRTVSSTCEAKSAPVSSLKAAAPAPPLPQPLPVPGTTGGSARIPAPDRSMAKLAVNLPSPSTSLSVIQPAAVPAVAPPVVPAPAATSMMPMLAPSSISARSPGVSASMLMPAAAKTTAGCIGITPVIHTGPIAQNPGWMPGSMPDPAARAQPGNGLSSKGPTLVDARSEREAGSRSGSGPTPEIIRRDNSAGAGGSNSAGVTPGKARGAGPSGPVIVPETGRGSNSAPAGSDGLNDASTGKQEGRKDEAREAREMPNFGPYMIELQRRIKRAWYPSRSDLSNRVVVMFKVHSNGTCSNVKVVKSSGIARHDHAAITAVENAAPFPPLPAGSPDSVDIEFTFDYNVFTANSRP